MQMERLDKEIDKTTTNLVSSNKKLKVIIDKVIENVIIVSRA
jgi:hypothetical protein